MSLTPRAPAETAQARSSAPRIGWFTALCLLVSNIIGGGIFTTTGFMARDVGDAVMVLALWAAGALLAIAGALSYAELPAAFPRAGGDYVYMTAAYGPMAGFLSGWASLTVGFGAGIAASAVGFASYAFRAADIAEQPLAVRLAALTLVWTLTAVHLRGVRTGGTLQRWLTVTKVTGILLFIGAGVLMGQGSWSHLSPSPTPVRPGALFIALVFVLYTYLGWNVVGYVAGEIAAPQRTIPRIVIGGTMFVAALYVALNAVYFYALPVDMLALPPVLPVAEKTAASLWGAPAAQGVAALLCLAIAGGVSAMTWAGPRAYWAMAQDGVFAKSFATVSPVSGVPARAMFLQSAWASLLIATGTFEQLIVFSGFILAGFTGLTLASVIVLRVRQPDLPRPYRVPLYPVIPALAVAVLALIVAESLMERPTESLLGVVTIAAGIPLYWLWRRDAPARQRSGS